MANLLHQCMTKATIAEGGELRHSLNWVTSRRGLLKVFADRLECGDWAIPYGDVEEATLFRVRQLFIPCYVLRVKAGGRTYQFGLNPGRFWGGELPFRVNRETGSLGYSWFSVGIRLAALAALGYVVWSWYR